MIELIKVSSGYKSKPVLQDISLRFEKGQLVSVIGPNGSGKSTLLKCMIGILPPTRGEILIDGEAFSLLHQRDIAKRISYLAQGKDTPDMTVRQMVLHGRFPHLSYPRRYTDEDRRIAGSAMEQTGVFPFADCNMNTLSGGMRQNAYIAMALAQNTDYILLDEPTTFLDISHQLALMGTLRRLADHKKGIITVMHDLPLALTLSDSIVVLKDGAVVMHASPQQVYESGILESVFGVALQRSSDGKEYCYRFAHKG